MGAASSPLQCGRGFLLPRNPGNRRLKQAARKKQLSQFPSCTWRRARREDRPFATMRSSATPQAGTDLSERHQVWLPHRSMARWIQLALVAATHCERVGISRETVRRDVPARASR